VESTEGMERKFFSMLEIKKKLLKKILRKSLEEDIGRGDITTFFCISPSKSIKATIFANEEGILCGIDLAKEVFSLVDPSINFKKIKKEGDEFKKADVIAKIAGKAFNILRAERTALNFLSLLSGIATYTHKFVEKVKNAKAKIRDTRKTTPLLRALEKYAVRVGGGLNHREGLWDGILIKDNHLRAAGIIKNKKIDKKKILETFEMIKENTSLEIEIEVENLSQFKKIISCLPDIILLDNFSFPQIKKAVAFRNKFFPQVKLEVSGGINLDNVEKIAHLGVDFIAVGSITHSPKAVDFSLEVDG